METSNIRNFCIISHVDHGKSTLADRFLELTGTVSQDKMRPQYLDQMPLERERGITIKLQPVTMQYNLNLKSYTLNLIDTPGHVDFSYEVSRSLVAVEGAILLVDAGQGIQAQTLANLYLAQKQKLSIIPVINKIDLKDIDLDSVKKELADLTNVDLKEIICVSAKKGINIEKVLQAVIEKIPAPQRKVKQSLKALIFDSYFDDYKGVVAYVRIFDGVVQPEDKIRFLSTGAESRVLEIGVFLPRLTRRETLLAGQIGYIVTGFKDIEKCRVGDTIAIVDEQLSVGEPLPGYQEPQSMVFAGIYSKEGADQEKLRRALMKLKLNDASLVFEPERSPALGFGFRAGFLGLLHLDIVQERLKREYGLDLIITSPSVAYRVFFSRGEPVLGGEKSLQGNNFKIIHSPGDLPDPSRIAEIQEPWMKVDIITPHSYLGSIMNLLSNMVKGVESKIKFISLEYIGQTPNYSYSKNRGEQRVILHYQIPLSLLLIDFYDKLKSISQGFASYSYQFLDYQKAEVVKLDILVAGELVDQLSTIVYRDWAYSAGRQITKQLKEILPRQLFEVKIQAAVGGKILASEKIPAMRKDVTAKLYGGDVTRKMKLLKKQKKGKKRLMKMGKVDIPAEAYWAITRKT